MYNSNKKYSKYPNYSKLFQIPNIQIVKNSKIFQKIFKVIQKIAKYSKLFTIQIQSHHTHTDVKKNVLFTIYHF
jgi:hypothetical protein